MSLMLHQHPFASYCWKALIALYERDVPFERHFVGDEADRARLAELWPMATIPVLVDRAADVTLPESTTIVEYVDGLGDAPRLIPADPATALQARLWDRVIDGHVMTPMQKIVEDNLRPEGRDRRSAWPTAPPRPRCSTPGSCTAGMRLASTEPCFPCRGPTTRCSAHAVRNATVGGIRDARTAGIRPANAPIRMAEAMPPDHASTGITTAQLFAPA